MRAFDVVGVNLQLWFGIDGGVVGEQQIFVGLLGVGLLGGLAHEDSAVKNALGFAIEDSVVILVAIAAGLGVLDDHMVVGQLVISSEIQPVEHAFDAFGGQGGADIVA